jgi:hypothetical protein
MTALTAHRRRALILLVLTLSVSLVVGGTAAGEKPPTPVYSPPPREASPFTPRDAFCSSKNNAFEGVTPNDPRLKAGKITVVMLTPPPDPSPAAELPGLKLGDPVDEAQTFANLVNKCGGIGGRKLDFHVLTESGNPLVDCLAATVRLHALIVVSLTASPAESCIANDEHTIMVTESDVSNSMLAAAHGRLVATGTNENVLQARILDLIQSGRLDGRKVAILPGSSLADLAFSQMATALLRENKIRPVPVAQAAVLLGLAVDPVMLPILTPSPGVDQSTTTTSGKPPLEVYGFADVSDQSLDQLRQVGGVTAAQSVNTIGLFAYTPVQDQQARLAESAGAFATMCNTDYAVNHGKAVKTADLPQPSPPAASSAPYLQVAKVCLALRIVSRALFSAGIDLTQAAAIKALHKLPYIENELADGVKKPRPNQVVNEPVKRVEQVVVLSQAEYPCKHPVLPKNPVDYRVCWAPVAGWDDGGHAVNAPPLGSTASTAPTAPVTTRPR